MFEKINLHFQNSVLLIFEFLSFSSNSVQFIFENFLNFSLPEKLMTFFAPTLRAGLTNVRTCSAEQGPPQK